MSDVAAPNNAQIADILARRSPADRERILAALDSGADPNTLASEIETAQKFGLGAGEFSDLAGATNAEALPSGRVRWDELLRGADPNKARAIVSARSAEDAVAKGWDPSTQALAGGDLANLIASRKLTTAPNPNFNPSVTDLPKMLWNLGAGAANRVLPDGTQLGGLGEDYELGNKPRTEANLGTLAAAGGIGASLAANGLFQNPLGALARTSLGFGAQGGTQGLGIAYPNSGEVEHPAYPGKATAMLDAMSQHGRGDIISAANKYGVRVGGYSDPQKLVDAMKSSVQVRRDAMVAAGYPQEEADAWAQDEGSKLTAMLDSEGGVEGMRANQAADTTRAVAGTNGEQGTIDAGYQSGLASNAFLPPAVAQAQLSSYGRLNPTLAPGGTSIFKAPKAIAQGLPGAIKGVFASPGLPAAPSRVTFANPAKPGALTRFGKPLLGLGGGVASMAMSLPSYLQASRNEAGLYDTATDPTGEKAGDLGHTLATEGTRAGSLGLQVAGGEVAVPRAIVNASQGAGAALRGTQLGQALAANAAKVRPGWFQGIRALPGAVSALRAVPTAASAGALGAAGVRAAGRALPAFALGSAAIDAGQNVGAATRSLQSLWSGDPTAIQTVDAENRALADNADWLQPGTGFWGAAGSGLGMAMRPTTAVRELLGAKDQIADAQRDADAGADTLAAKQVTAPLQQLNKYRAQVAANGGDTSAIDAQLRRISSGPSAQAWGDVGKWQNGMVGWAINPLGDHRTRGELPFSEQYAKMDDATRAQADAIMKGVAEGTVDPERARVALGIPAISNWSPDQQRDPDKGADYIAMNQRHVLEHANAAKGGYQPYTLRPAGAQPTWKPAGQWQNPAAMAPKPPTAATPQPAPAKPPVLQPGVPAGTPTAATGGPGAARPWTPRPTTSPTPLPRPA
jgi:hypothetical protein